MFDAFKDLDYFKKEPLDNYSSQQRDLIHAPIFDNPHVIVNACPGAGKTYTLIERVSHCIKKGVDPQSVLLLSFTKQAANQFATKLSEKIPGHNIDCATMHSVAYKQFLKIHSNTRPDLITEKESMDIATQLQSCFNVLKDIDLDEILYQVQFRRESESKEQQDFFGWGAIISKYKELLINSGKIDYTMLIEQLVEFNGLLPKMYKFIYIDEYQDLSFLQIKFILKLINRKSKYSCFWVGDPNQSIYSFKGSVNYLFDLLKKDSGTDPLVKNLSLSFRCCDAVLQCANNLIKHNGILNQDITAHNNIRDVKGSVCFSKVSGIANELNLLKKLFEQIAPSGKKYMCLVRTNKLKSKYQEQGIPCETIHKAKGLEWDIVILLGCDESNLPHPLGDLQEERRLFYVAITRAKKTFLAILQDEKVNPKNGVKKPSRFISQAGMDEVLLDNLPQL